MYHERFRGDHYQIGFRWGSRLLNHGNYLLDSVPFPITQERLDFAEQCRPFYKEWFPEALEEIRGIAEGQGTECRVLEAVLLSMYCIMPQTMCTCFAFRDGEHTILARNSDFFTALEKLYMNCIYKFDDESFSFQGNTTAFVEMEDGINEYGLALGLTSVYPKKLGYGLNAGMLLRYGLETCKTVAEFTDALGRIPIASSQTFTAVDRGGKAAVVECNADRIEICRLDGDQIFVGAVNSFHLDSMKSYSAEGIDDWKAEERYQTVCTAFRQKSEKAAVPYAMDILSGAYGLICQYDRQMGKDTVWSAVYDVGVSEIYRCEGNPSRKKFIKDDRFAAFI